MEIKEKKIEKKQVVYISFKGAYDEIAVLLGELVGYIIAKGLQMAGPPFGIYFNSPHEVKEEELLYEIGIPFTGDAEEEGRIKIKTIPEQLVISRVYKGPYSECGMALGSLGEYAYKNGYQIVGPPMEIFISDPNETPEKDLVTEVNFPVIKK